jgi:ribosomal protein S16
VNAETTAVMKAVLEALDVPYAATVGEDLKRADILEKRLMYTVVVLRDLVKRNGDLEWLLGYLRDCLAEHPATGYITGEEAHARLEAGATWTEAVTPVRTE